MPITAPLIIVTFLLAAASASAEPRLDQSAQPRVTGPEFAQLTIEQRVIIRIPTMVPPRPPQPDPRDAALDPPMPPDPPIVPVVKEVKGPKCLKLRKIRGAFISPASGITMVTERNERFRTHFDRMCIAASFYSGFYIEPSKDGELCAGRDTLHARNGSTCRIERFSKLVPQD